MTTRHDIFHKMSSAPNVFFDEPVGLALSSAIKGQVVVTVGTGEPYLQDILDLQPAALIVRSCLRNLTALLAEVILDVRQSMYIGPYFQLTLTPCERHVLRYISLGLCYKDIAKRLGKSPKTVQLQASALFRKLGVDNREAAAKKYWGNQRDNFVGLDNLL